MIEEKIRKDIFEVADLCEADDSAYWQGRSPAERVEAIEFMRKVMFGPRPKLGRLGAILSVWLTTRMAYKKGIYLDQDIQKQAHIQAFHDLKIKKDFPRVAEKGQT